MKQQYMQVFREALQMWSRNTLSQDPPVRTILIIKLRQCFLHYSQTSVQWSFTKAKWMIVQQAGCRS